MFHPGDLVEVRLGEFKGFRFRIVRARAGAYLLSPYDLWAPASALVMVRPSQS